jgi:exportin-T
MGRQNPTHHVRPPQNLLFLSSPFGPVLRNKFSHTLTLLFLATYLDRWPTFFTDLFALMRPAESTSQTSFSPHVSLLFFHFVIEISEEVADQIIKGARQFSSDRHVRDARVRDAVRERDAAQINEAVLTIVADYAERLQVLRKAEAATSRETSEVLEVVDWGIRTFGSYAGSSCNLNFLRVLKHSIALWTGWVDINLTVTPTTVPLLFTLLSDPSLSVRMAAAGALRRIVSKGLKEPADKLQLIKVLSLGQVMDSLEERTRAEQIARGDDTDEGEESYREALGRLLNVHGLELVKLADVSYSIFHVLDRLTLRRMLLPMKCGRKVPGCYNKSSPSCLDLWRTNTTIHAQLCSQCCRQSLPVYIPAAILIYHPLTCK